MIHTRDKIQGSFGKSREEAKELVMEIVANFHYRTGKSNPDGSMGEINITPGELTDALAYVYLVCMEGY